MPFSVATCIDVGNILDQPFDNTEQILRNEGEFAHNWNMECNRMHKAR